MDMSVAAVKILCIQTNFHFGLLKLFEGREFSSRYQTP